MEAHNYSLPSSPPQGLPANRSTKPRAPVTFTLIGLNVAVYVLMIVSGISPISPTTLQVLQWGANFGPLTEHGQWWRLLSAVFLHFGIIHIGFNMFVLYQVGLFTEQLFGGPLYLLLYLLAGVGGNVVGLWLHPNVVSAGASGAIFGVYGALLAFLLINRRSLVSEGVKSVTRSVLIFLGYNLVFGLADRHTDLTAHISGLAIGFLAGLPLARLRSNAFVQR